jgi:hypothetical protein
MWKTAVAGGNNVSETNKKKKNMEILNFPLMLTE